jgi:hypothetical protein
VLVVTGIMVGVTKVQWLLFFLMSIMSRVEDGSFAFWCRRVDSSFFLFFFFFGFLPLFSPSFLLYFFTNFTLIYRGWNRDMGSLLSMNLGSWFAWKGSPVIVRKHQPGTANTRLSKLIGSTFLGWLFSGFLGGKLAGIRLKV